MSINCIIIDDEAEAREGLKLLLQDDPDINIIATCSDGITAIEVINKLKPHLLLLDIQMPEANGFEVLNSIDMPIPEVIFITAYDQFALKAFEVHALDYLLKPFSDERFNEALTHAKKKISLETKNKTSAAQQMAKEAIANQNNEDSVNITKNKLVVKADGLIQFIDKKEISWVEAYDYYIKIHIKGKYYLVRETMRNVLIKLSEEFIRIHKSSIINVSFIKSLEKQANNELQLVLKTGEKLKVSRNYKGSLMDKLGEK